ncbi:unnamed protein product, partial [Ectocarpus sp. 13 AM-2016]
ARLDVSLPRNRTPFRAFVAYLTSRCSCSCRDNSRSPTWASPHLPTDVVDGLPCSPLCQACWQPTDLLQYCLSRSLEYLQQLRRHFPHLVRCTELLLSASHSLRFLL